MNKKKTILAGITAAAVVLSSGMIAFAETDTAGTTEPEGCRGRSEVMCSLTDDQRAAVMQARIDSLKEAVAELTDTGVITQDAAEERPAGLLTEEQKTALNDAVKTIFADKLAELVDDGTIIQDQADQLLTEHAAMRMGPGGKSGFSGHPGFKGKQDSATEPESQ